MINSFKTHWFYHRGHQLMKAGELNDALKSFDRAFCLNQKDSGALLYKGMILSGQERYEKAIEHINKALSLEPDNFAFHLFLGIVLYDKQDFEQAMQTINRAIELCPENNLILSFKDLMLLAKGENDLDVCLSLRRKISQTNPEFGSRFLVFCEAFLSQNKHLAKKLEEQIESNILFENDLKENRFNAYRENIIFSFKLALLRLIKKKHPGKKLSYEQYKRGLSCLLQHNIHASIAAFKKALKHIPNFSKAQEKLLGLYYSNGNYDALYNYLKTAPEYIKVFEMSDYSSVFKIKPHLIYRLGFLKYHKGDYDESIKIFQTATQNGSNWYYPYYYLGLSFLGKRDLKAARDSFKKAIEQLNPKIVETRLDEMIRVMKIAK